LTYKDIDKCSYYSKQTFSSGDYQLRGITIDQKDLGFYKIYTYSYIYIYLYLILSHIFDNHIIDSLFKLEFHTIFWWCKHV